MSDQIQDLLDDTEQLISLPAAYVRLNEQVEDPTCTADQIAQVITQDVALTAHLLRVANSPLYGFATQIDTVSRAVTVLGTRQVRDLALATTACKTFDGIPNKLVSMEGFWQHSILCALCARNLAMECLKRQREAVFVAGLLHDIGHLVLYRLLPDLSRQTLQACQDGPNSLESQDAEREIMGFDHAHVGGELAHRWSLPGNLQEAIAYHHDPAQAKQSRVETAIVHIANSIAVLAELDTPDLDQAPHIQSLAWELTGLDTDIIPPIMASARAQLGGAKALLMGD
ncbi:MAG TPA: HDOD domain-containing protein [Gammaproteobacteria bacterium]|nr:HDOD domain-containing protein [Gammaproteobacteria bacterium]